jgi:hypothetical protein
MCFYELLLAMLGLERTVLMPSSLTIFADKVIIITALFRKEKIK